MKQVLGERVASKCFSILFLQNYKEKYRINCSLLIIENLLMASLNLLQHSYHTSPQIIVLTKIKSNENFVTESSFVFYLRKKSDFE